MGGIPGDLEAAWTLVETLNSEQLHQLLARMQERHTMLMQWWENREDLLITGGIMQQAEETLLSDKEIEAAINYGLEEAKRMRRTKQR